MDKKHLFWIIPLALFIGIIIGNELKYHSDKAPDNNLVENLWDCHEGCLYAEWIQYGYKNLTKSSELYNKCTKACWYGDKIIKSAEIN